MRCAWLLLFFIWWWTGSVGQKWEKAQQAVLDGFVWCWFWWVGWLVGGFSGSLCTAIETHGMREQDATTGRLYHTRTMTFLLVERRGERELGCVPIRY